MTENCFALRIVCCDYYLSRPITNFDQTGVTVGEDTTLVSVIRIFGSTDSGHKCCLHVHNVLPYFYVASVLNEVTEEYLKLLHSNLESALANQSKSKLKHSSHRRFVHSISVVTATPFYGYHSSKHSFLKIAVFDPIDTKRSVKLLESGAVLDTIFQPYESHIPYILKFFIDHKLYGMDFIRLKSVKVRRENRSLLGDCSINRKENISIEDSLPTVSRYRHTVSLLAECVARQSTCELECDCVASDILNSTDHSEGMKNPGLNFIWEDERNRRAVLNVSENLVSELQERESLPRCDSEVHFRKVFEEKLRAWTTSSLPTNNISLIDSDKQPRSQHLCEHDETPFQNLADYCSVVLGADEKEVMNILETSSVDLRFLSQSNVDSLPGTSAGVSNVEEPINESFRFVELNKSFTVTGVTTPLVFLEDQGLGICEDGAKNHIGTFECESADEIDALEMSRIIAVSSEGEDSDTADQLIHDGNENRRVKHKVLSRKKRRAVQVDTKIPTKSMEQVAAEKRGTDTVHTAADVAQSEFTVIQPSSASTSLSSKIPSRTEMIAWIRSNCHVNTSDNIECNKSSVSPDETLCDQSYLAETIESDGASDDDFLVPSSQLPNHSSALHSADFESNKVKPIARCSQVSPKGASHPAASLDSSRSNLIVLDSTFVAAAPVPETPGTTSKMGLFADAECHNVSELQNLTTDNSFGFKYANVTMNKSQTNQVRHISVLSMELHVNTRGDLLPDPEFDCIGSIAYAYFSDDAHNGSISTGCIILIGSETGQDPMAYNRSFQLTSSVRNCKRKIVTTERDLIAEFVSLVRSQDPDILAGFEIQMLSWGFLIERAKFLGLNLCQQLSRIPGDKENNKCCSDDDWWALVNISVAGRVVLNLWRILRHEITLNLYSFENAAFHILRQRFAKFSFSCLTSWFSECKQLYCVLQHYLLRAAGNIQMLLKLDIIGRTSELAKLFGIQFYEVLSRGSQFRVESMMLRMTSANNFICVSPSVSQRNNMAAPACIPLTMEPKSGFYTDPVLVLDFQSLYPSMIIAYNYCYSTCLGKIENWDMNPIEFGCSSLNVDRKLVFDVKDSLSISPAGVAFLHPSTRKGVLPMMLEEILGTRIMVKNSMKEYKDDATLQKILDARQLGLKLISNVTYGYTSANFSGRMPCVEVADSIVHKGRETLERAIRLVHSNKQWDAEVIYGDTDSMFVLLRGRSKSEAFSIGKQIAEAVTKDNPKPVKLKFEKVYFPCVLLTKKRYVGYAYESESHQKPVFDAKGIETVRRDTCPLVSKILEKSLGILFDTGDISRVKSFVVEQFSRISGGRVSLIDFIFAKEYRGQAGYKPNSCVPALRIACKKTAKDPRAEPRIGERVPYVVTCTFPREPLICGVRDPQDLLKNASLRINTIYYITSPLCGSLNRIFNLLNQDTRLWFSEVPKSDRRLTGLGYGHSSIALPVGDQKTLSQFVRSVNCLLCGNSSREIVCGKCQSQKPQAAAAVLNDIVKSTQRRYHCVTKICELCLQCNASTTIGSCISLDCPVYPKRVQLSRDCAQISTLLQTLRNF